MFPAHILPNTYPAQHIGTPHCEMTRSSTHLALAEGAELALECAHIRVVDVAVDHVCDCVAACPHPQLIRCTLDSLRSIRWRSVGFLTAGK